MKAEVIKKRDELLGAEFDTISCGKCFVIDYSGANNILVMFYEPMCLVKTRMDHLKTGLVRNPLYPSVRNLGYIGIGEFDSTHSSYKFWVRMFRRVFDEKQGYNKAYKDVVICKGWLNFQNFARWCEEQKYLNAVDDKGKHYQLDKGILVKGNRIYSPETCCFVPQKVNALLISVKASRGKFPIGVTYCKRDKVYKAILSRNGSVITLGQSKDVEKSFQLYKRAKENYIEEVAEYWKGRIDEKVYQALLNYEVEITD